MGRRARDKQGSHVQKKPSGSNESATTDPAVAKLLMSACVAQWGEHHGSKCGAQFLRAEDWAFESLRTLSVENSTQRVGLDNMRRLQVTEIAHEVARQYESGKAAVAAVTVVAKCAHVHPHIVRTSTLAMSYQLRAQGCARLNTPSKRIGSLSVHLTDHESTQLCSVTELCFESSEWCDLEVICPSFHFGTVSATKIKGFLS